MSAPQCHWPREQRGVTLVELMVGLALGLAMTAALLMLFANASSSGRHLARAGTHIENGRYVAELLREELRIAGYYGEAPVGGAAYATPDPCSTTPGGWSGAPFTLPSPVTGYLASDDLPCLVDRKEGTQAIAVRRLSIDRVDPATLAPTNTRYHVQYSFCTADATPPMLVYAADPAAFTMRNRSCTAANPVRAVVSRIYYVARCHRCEAGGDADPTLKRVELVGDRLVTTALADGVEQLRFEYGFDTDANGSPDVYVPQPGAAGPTAQWSKVMAVKLHFIARSLERSESNAGAGAQTFQLGGLGTVTTPDDGYARNAYTSVVRLMNPSGALEVQ